MAEATYIEPRLAEWLAGGDNGTSSKSIAFWLVAGVHYGTWGPDTPSDCGDLGRCLRLLECIPEWKSRMGEMAKAGGLWPTFSRRWAEIEASLLSETGGKLPGKDDRYEAPKTYALLQAVHEEAYAKDRPAFKEVKLGAGMTVRFGA